MLFPSLRRPQKNQIPISTTAVRMPTTASSRRRRRVRQQASTHLIFLSPHLRSLVTSSSAWRATPVRTSAMLRDGQSLPSLVCPPRWTAHDRSLAETRSKLAGALTTMACLALHESMEMALGGAAKNQRLWQMLRETETLDGLESTCAPCAHCIGRPCLCRPRSSEAMLVRGTELI